MVKYRLCLIPGWSHDLCCQTVPPHSLLLLTFWLCGSSHSLPFLYGTVIPSPAGALLLCLYNHLYTSNFSCLPIPFHKLFVKKAAQIFVFVLKRPLFLHKLLNCTFAFFNIFSRTETVISLGSSVFVKLNQIFCTSSLTNVWLVFPDYAFLLCLFYVLPSMLYQVLFAAMVLGVLWLSGAWSSCQLLLSRCVYWHISSERSIIPQCGNFAFYSFPLPPYTDLLLLVFVPSIQSFFPLHHLPCIPPFPWYILTCHRLSILAVFPMFCQFL